MNNWIRYSITAVILFSLCVQYAGKLLLVADYYANKSVYLSNCENKFRPKLHCNGHCLLMKKMQKAENKDTQAPEKKPEWKFEVLSGKSFYDAEYILAANLRINYFTPFSTGMPVDYSLSFFHPPSV